MEERDVRDAVRRMVRLCGGHYVWPSLYEAVMGEVYPRDVSPSETESRFMKRLIRLICSAWYVNTDEARTEASE